jgi:tetratricopeptide (TPR) repeat protein
MRLTLCIAIIWTVAAGSAMTDDVAGCQAIDAPDTAEAHCTAIITATTGQASAWALNNRGIIRAGRGDYLGAIADYSEALQRDPEFAPAFSNRGNAHAVLGDLLAALADHTRAIELDPDYVAAWHNRGVDREELGQYREALEDYRHVLTLEPNHKGSHVGLATANCKLGRVKTSAKARLTAIEKGLLDPTEMQELLQAEGFYKGPIDGIFGKGSRAALRAWTRKGCLAAA